MHKVQLVRSDAHIFRLGLPSNLPIVQVRPEHSNPKRCDTNQLKIRPLTNDRLRSRRRRWSMNESGSKGGGLSSRCKSWINNKDERLWNLLRWRRKLVEWAATNPSPPHPPNTETTLDSLRFYHGRADTLCLA